MRALVFIKGLMSNLSAWVWRFGEQARSGRWATHLKWGQRGLLFAILTYLIYKLTQIGWSEITGHFPTSPVFYLLSVAIFLSVPISEVFNYRIITDVKIPHGLGLFSRKRVYNDTLFSYSGEAYLIRALSVLPKFSGRKALIAVKDNNLVSALVSNSWAILLVIALAVLGGGDVLKKIWQISPVLVGGFAVLCVLLYIFFTAYFHRISSLTRVKNIQVTAIHSLKVLIVATLQVCQWASALPSEGPQTWLMFLAVQTLIKRIPGLPNGDLVFLGVGLSLVGFTQGLQVEVSAMLLAAAATTQCVQFIAFIVTTPRG